VHGFKCRNRKYNDVCMSPSMAARCALRRFDGTSTQRARRITVNCCRCAVKHIARVSRMCITTTHKHTRERHAGQRVGSAEREARRHIWLEQHRQRVDVVLVVDLDEIAELAVSVDRRFACDRSRQNCDRTQQRAHVRSPPTGMLPSPALALGIDAARGDSRLSMAPATLLALRTLDDDDVGGDAPPAASAIAKSSNCGTRVAVSSTRAPHRPCTHTSALVATARALADFCVRARRLCSCSFGGHKLPEGAEAASTGWPAVLESGRRGGGHDVIA
jgi:hypothetical protein